MPSDRQNLVVRLSDGRQLGYAEHGDPEGRPLIFFHGGTLCRLFGAAMDRAARESGVRLIAPDRPGIGLSDAKPGRTMLDWAADVGELADRLNLARFGVLGHSLGGAYVLGCAYAMPRRLSGAGIAGGALPIGPRSALPPLFRMPTHLQALVLSSMIRLLMFGPRPIRQALRKSDPPPDRRLFASPEFTLTVERSVREGLRRGLGAIRDDGAAIFQKKWGFAIEEIRMPVHIWFSELDSMVPPAIGKKLEAALPQCTARFPAEQGHMSVLIDNLDEALAVLSPLERGGRTPDPAGAITPS